MLKMIGVWNDHCQTLSQCKKIKGVGILAGCSDFIAPPCLTVFYFVKADGREGRLKAQGVVMVPIDSEHMPCAEAALVQLATEAALDATQKGLSLIS